MKTKEILTFPEAKTKEECEEQMIEISIFFRRSGYYFLEMGFYTEGLLVPRSAIDNFNDFIISFSKKNDYEIDETKKYFNLLRDKYKKLEKKIEEINKENHIKVHGQSSFDKILSLLGIKS